MSVSINGELVQLGSFSVNGELVQLVYGHQR